MTPTMPSKTPKTTALALAAACLASLLLAPCARAQVCGDVTADNLITANDALRVLKAAVGVPVTLVCQDQCAALEPRIAALETLLVALEPRIAALEPLLAHVTVVGDNLVLTGMNFQVVSGSGSTDGTINGKGNIIVGYDETNSNKDKRTGSHNLVIGRYHSYSNYGGIIAGEDNDISGIVASVLGGAKNSAAASGAVVVGGAGNVASGVTSVIVAGELNKASGRSCSVLSGNSNLCSGLESAVEGGAQNLCSGGGSVIGGGSNRTLGSPLGWLAGSLGPVF